MAFAPVPALAQTDAPPPPAPAQTDAPPPPALAQTDAPPIPANPRVRTEVYQPDQIVPLQVAAGYQLMVEFAPDERIESVAVGDSAAWQVTPTRAGDRIFVKALQTNLVTNLTVVTNARTYTFELNPLYGPSTDMAYILRFTYPTTQAAAEPEPVATVSGRYRLSGNQELRPSRISDDGVHTYIEWPRDRALPAVYAIDAHGQEALVNGMMRDDLFVIDSVETRLVFRIDDQTARATRVAERGRP